MSKVAINSFNAGELSPYLYARSDFEKYRSGCLTMENFVPLPYGGATRRPAIQYLGNSKQDDKIRLIPFTASVSDSYCLELGDKYIRFWKNGTLIEGDIGPVEVGSPWSDTDLNLIKFSQSVDVMWLVHPDHAPQRLSRFSDTSWTIGDEQFDYPPLREENETDITMSPSATTGTITLTSSQDFFDEGHVGSFMAFNTPRLTSNQSVSGDLSATGVSEELYVSNANFEFSTSNNWAGRIVIQRSLDGGTTFEDYVTVGDTTGASANGYKNFTFSSDTPEPLNARIRILWTGSAGTLTYQLKTDDPWNTLVKITGYTDAQNVTAEVLDEFQDIESDYSTWATSTSYSVGDKIVTASEFTYTTENYSSTLISGVTGASYNDGKYYVTQSSPTSRILNELSFSGSAFTVDSSYDLTSEFVTLDDVAFYNGNIYLLGETSANDLEIARYNTSISKQEIIYASNDDSEYINIEPIGLEYTSNGIYCSLSFTYVPTGTFWESMYRLNPSTASDTGDGAGFSNSGTGYFEDMIQTGSTLLSLRSQDNKVWSYGKSGNSSDFKASFDILPSGITPKGFAFDGDNAWIVSDAGTFYKYIFVEKSEYYECVRAHTSGVFETDLSNGYWAIRNPITTNWTEGAFSDYRGHPASIALFESRLVYGGTESEPDTIWLSQIDDFSNFQLGSIDTDAIKLTLNSGMIDEIRWMVPQERLVIGTAGSEWSLGASDERKAITPTGFDLKRKTTYGCNTVQGILVNSAVLFLMRQGRKVREWPTGFNLQEYVANDLSILAEHITGGGVSLWDYQQQPDNILWSIRNDGTLLGFTYERDQNVSGWHRHSNDEFNFESIAIIPRDNEEDELWVSVNMDGTRIIGRLNDREWGTDYTSEWQGSDLWVDYQSAGDAVHLAGKTVDIVIDGVIQDQEVVDGSGNISATLGTVNIVGLPFTSTLAPVYLNSPTRYGFSQGDKTDVRQATIRFKDTFSAKIGSNLDHLEDVRFDPDETALYSEDAPTWFDNASEFLKTTYIVQSDPMPCTVLATIAYQEAG